MRRRGILALLVVPAVVAAAANSDRIRLGPSEKNLERNGKTPVEGVS